MFEIADRARFAEFLQHAPAPTGFGRADLLGWLGNEGNFPVAGAPATAEGEPHAVIVWGEEPTLAYRVYVVPQSEIDIELASLHTKVFSGRVHRDLEPPLFEAAVKLLLRASFEPEVYDRMLGDIRAGVTQKRSSLPGDAVLEPEVGRWHRYAITDGAGLDRNITSLCAIRFMCWS